jgi:hypothetical protein
MGVFLAIDHVMQGDTAASWSLGGRREPIFQRALI